MQLDYDVIIIGGGPAGSATALQLAQRAPDLAPRTLLLDAAEFPRRKLCGGGIVRQSDSLLACLGVNANVPSVPVHEMRFEYLGGHSIQKGRSLFRVVRREEFDHALLREVRERKVVVHEGQPVATVGRDGDRIVVRTRGGDTYTAGVLVGADGARSLVRRSLVGATRARRFVALEVLTPGHDDGKTGESNTAVFDFRPAQKGLRGYIWDFPSLLGGQRIMNRGIGGSTWPAGTALKDLFADGLGQRGIDSEEFDLEGSGAPLYDSERPQSSERVLLAGDAVGIDPWLGEGISVAIGTGIIAGHTAVEAIETGSFGFEDHRERILESAIGQDLVRKNMIAEIFYLAARMPGGLESWSSLGTWS